MGRIQNIIDAEDFNYSLINLLIDLYSSNYENHFNGLYFDEKKIIELNETEKDKLTKLAAIIEYVGNRRENAKLYDWIYSSELKLENPYTPGVNEESFARLKRIITAPREFSSRNVFYDYTTIKPV
ncbi:MAG TPA: hypothetical protein PLX37_04625 [Sedimentibacter sp.]|nr:hypothetical protein [Sedimentibacter sp.]HNZ82806.1 hypothetical protein [Sedimentibacter sp.]HOH69735.1 hypothetical protein [Sedimentibacter sp.]